MEAVNNSNDSYSIAVQNGHVAAAQAQLQATQVSAAHAKLKAAQDRVQQVSLAKRTNQTLPRVVLLSRGYIALQLFASPKPFDALH